MAARRPCLTEVQNLKSNGMIKITCSSFFLLEPSSLLFLLTPVYNSCITIQSLTKGNIKPSMQGFFRGRGLDKYSIAIQWWPIECSLRSINQIRKNAHRYMRVIDCTAIGWGCVSKKVVPSYVSCGCSSEHSPSIRVHTVVPKVCIGNVASSVLHTKLRMTWRARSTNSGLLKRLRSSYGTKDPLSTVKWEALGPNSALAKACHYSAP